LACTLAGSRTPKSQKFFGSFFQKRTLPAASLPRNRHDVDMAAKVVFRHVNHIAGDWIDSKRRRRIGMVYDRRSYQIMQ
jgi:hypothetical protein